MLDYISEFFHDPITGFSRKHTPVKIINLLLNQFSKRILKSSYVLGYPIHLTIEATNLCNLNCPMCSTGKDFAGRKKAR